MISLAGDIPLPDGQHSRNGGVLDTPSANPSYYHRTDEAAASSYGLTARLEFVEKLIYFLLFLLLIASVSFELISFKSVAISFPESSFVVMIFYCLCHASIMFVFYLYQRYIHQSPAYTKLSPRRLRSLPSHGGNPAASGAGSAVSALADGSLNYNNSYTSLRGGRNRRQLLEMAQENGLYRIYRPQRSVHLMLYVPCGLLQTLSLSVLFVCVSVGVSGCLMIVLMQLSIPFSIIFSCFINKTVISKKHACAVGLVVLGGMFGILANILGEFGDSYYYSQSSGYINAWWYGVIVLVCMIFNGFQILYMNVSNLTVFKEVSLRNLSSLRESELEALWRSLRTSRELGLDISNNSNNNLLYHYLPELDASFDGKIPQPLLNAWISVYQAVFTFVASPVLFYLQRPETNVYKDSFHALRESFNLALNGLAGAGTDGVDGSHCLQKYTFWVFMSVCVPLLMGLVGGKMSLLFVKIGTLCGVTLAFVLFQLGCPSWLLGRTYLESSDECLLLAILCGVVGSIMLLIDFNPTRNTYFFDSNTKTGPNGVNGVNGVSGVSSLGTPGPPRRVPGVAMGQDEFSMLYGGLGASGRLGLLDTEYSQIMSQTSRFSSNIGNDDIEIDILTKTRTKTKTKTKTRVYNKNNKNNAGGPKTGLMSDSDMEWSALMTPSQSSVMTRGAGAGGVAGAAGGMEDEHEHWKSPSSRNYEDLRNDMNQGMANIQGKGNKRAFVEYLLEQHQSEVMREEFLREQKRLEQERSNKSYSFSQEFYNNNHALSAQNAQIKKFKKHQEREQKREQSRQKNGKDEDAESLMDVEDDDQFISQQYQKNLKKYYAYVKQQQAAKEAKEANMRRQREEELERANRVFDNGFPSFNSNLSMGTKSYTNLRSGRDARDAREARHGRYERYERNGDFGARMGTRPPRARSVHSAHSVGAAHSLGAESEPWAGGDYLLASGDGGFECEAFAINNPLLDSAQVQTQDVQNLQYGQHPQHAQHAQEVERMERKRNKQRSRSKPKMIRKHSDPFLYH